MDTTKTQSIDCSARINGTRVFGTLVWHEANCAACKGVIPAYEGDTEQCDDCGGDQFTVIERQHDSGLAIFTGHALACDKCGSVYQLRCEE